MYKYYLCCALPLLFFYLFWQQHGKISCEVLTAKIFPDLENRILQVYFKLVTTFLQSYRAGMKVK